MVAERGDNARLKKGGLKARLKNGLVNTALVIGALLASYAVLEFFFFRLLLPGFPLTWWVFTPSGPDFFLLNAGRQFQSPGYIALLGDSYAVGLGDWLRANGNRKDKPYHSAHVLRDLLGVEVVDYGRPGVGSPEAMVLRPTRIFDDGGCLAIPRVALPGRFLIYFFEGNDLDDNYIILSESIGLSETDVRAPTDRFLRETYANKSAWRCHGFLGDFGYRMLRFMRYSRRDLQAADQPLAPKNEVLIGGTAVAAPSMHVPSMGLNDTQIEQAAVVFERSLAWLRRRFQGIPVTVAYVPAPASVYRYASAVTSTYVLDPTKSLGRDDKTPGPVFPAAAIYANSQKICQRIRAAAMESRADFIDVRPSLRKKAAQVPLHGPHDWGHLNETGYRALAAGIAERITQAPQDRCSDDW